MPEKILRSSSFPSRTTPTDATTSAIDTNHPIAAKSTTPNIKMHLTSILALSASLLTSQAQAQYANPLVNPAAYMNGNIEVNPDPYAHANPYPNPNPNPNPNPVVNANPNPVHYPMAAYMTPSTTPSMVPSMSMSMSHSMRPMSTNSAMHSMGPMNSLIPMHPPSPMSSMMTMASSMKPMATPARMVHGLNMPAPVQPIRYGGGGGGGGGGGIALVEPMPPGSDVAPVLMGKPHGKDEGNSFCMGMCYPRKEEAKCGKPYVSTPIADASLFCPDFRTAYSLPESC